MEVWVRSQDENGFFQIGGVQYYCIEQEHHLYCTLKSNSITREDLGKYPTKERCIEIIDEIQELFMRSLVTLRNVSSPNPSIEYHEQSVVVYEMPKE
jgi:hypothetical protein